MNIAQVILNLREALEKECGRTPQQINNGRCDDFANRIEQQIPGAIAVWGDEISVFCWSENVLYLPDWFSYFAPYHCFIEFIDRFYDSECPDGCDYADELPFYQRQISNNYGLTVEVVCRAKAGK